MPTNRHRENHQTARTWNHRANNCSELDASDVSSGSRKSENRHRQGHSARQIARELNLTRCTVRRYLRSEMCPDWVPGRMRRSGLDRYRDWIIGHLAEGHENAAEIYRQLAEQGYRGSYGSVRRYVAKQLKAAGKTRAGVAPAKAPIPPRPSHKRLAYEWVRRPEKRKPEEQGRLDAIRASSTEIAAGLDLADEFADLIRKRSGESLSAWLTKGETSSCYELRQFAVGIRSDEKAVNGAVTERWSNGPVEGHVNRLKAIKHRCMGEPDSCSYEHGS